MLSGNFRFSVIVILCFLTGIVHPCLAVDIDDSEFQPNGSFQIEKSRNRLKATWEADHGKGELFLNFLRGVPLIQSIRMNQSEILNQLNPEFILWIGTRDLEKRQGWRIFFDRVQRTIYSSERTELTPKNVSITRKHGRMTIKVDGLSSRHFKGSLVFTLFKGSSLIKMEAQVSTERPATALLYHCGLSRLKSDNLNTHFYHPLGEHKTLTVEETSPAPLQTQFRAVAVSSEKGTIGIMPPPHQFLYPLDFVENYGYNWAGKNYLDLIRGFSWGIRQSPVGDDRYSPWVNAPPGSVQKLAAFLLVSDKDGASVLDRMASYTRNDQFKELPGYKTLTSHYHIEHALDYIQKQAQQNTTGIPKGLEQPEFVDVFQEMGVDIVHLAEFHNGRTPRLKTEQRLKQLKVLHDECERLSTNDFLLLPGEEPNVHLGGHWISFFPKPVYWVLNDGDNQPFHEDLEGFGSVYHVRNAKEVEALFKKENGLMWTAHARIKSSTGFPDAYQNKSFFKNDHFLGAAWKAMPADYSRDTLGWRVIDLLDDMNNWGTPKQVIGEVDAFKVFKGYELYGAMNINYIKLDQLPKYEDGWQPVLDTLRAGTFFVTTGEVLIPACSFGGKKSGDRFTGDLSKIRMDAQLEWTYPLAFAEVVSGDGINVYRQRIELNETSEFGELNLTNTMDLSGRNWVRLEVWDIATNGAFTQPVWLHE